MSPLKLLPTLAIMLGLLFCASVFCACSTAVNPRETYAYNTNSTATENQLVVRWFTNSEPSGPNFDTVKARLAGKLSHEEALLIHDPLAATAEMTNYARGLTLGLVDDFEKVEALTTAINHRSRQVTFQCDGPYRSAAQSFAIYQSSDASLRCWEATTIIVAMARALGLQAYMANVYTQMDGSTTPHVCAAIFLKRRCLLADSFYWVGVPHREFELYNDRQALADFLALSADVRALKVICQLEPNGVQPLSRKCAFLIDECRWDEALGLIPNIRVRKGGAYQARLLEAYFQARRGNLLEAEKLYRRAIEVDPSQFSIYYSLADVLIRQSKFRDAYSSLRSALDTVHSRGEESRAREALRSLKELIEQK